MELKVGSSPVPGPRTKDESSNLEPLLLFQPRERKMIITNLLLLG